MDDDSLTADRSNEERYRQVNKVTITKLNTGYRIEFEPSQQSRVLTNAESFYCRFHPTVEIQHLAFRPKNGYPGLYLELKFNSLHNFDIMDTENKECLLAVGY